MMHDDDNIYSIDVDEAEELGIDPHLSLEANPSGGNDAYDAAIDLREYINRTGNWGTSAHKDSTIAALQKRMGMGSDAIGIAGPKTRARATALGVTLPPKPGTPVTSAPGVTGGVTAMQTGAAIALRDYLTNSGSFGSKANPDRNVAQYQKDMGKLDNDGIVGPKTRARAHVLGVTLPTAIPASTQKLVEQLEKSGGPSPANAAKVLASYLKETKRFGTKAYPDARVKRLQSLMGGIDADGIVGPKTNARARALGVTLPVRPSAPTHAAAKPTDSYKVMVGQAVIKKPASPANAQAGAKALFAYLTKYKRFGSKGKPDAMVAKYQRLMGGLVNDGIVGPKTAARAKALGVTLPNRPMTGGQVHAPGKQSHAQRMHTAVGGSTANQHGVAAHMKDSAEKIAAKKKLAKIDVVMTAVPEFPLWDTLKFRREVLSLLRQAAGV